MDDTIELLLSDLFVESAKWATCSVTQFNNDYRAEKAKEAIREVVRKNWKQGPWLQGYKAGVRMGRSPSFGGLDYDGSTGCDHSRTLETEDVDDFTYCPTAGARSSLWRGRYEPDKDIKFDDAVLAVLQRMEWSDDGKLGVITGGQLERKLYERCNKAFDAMGGKWNRKAGGIVFATDPRPQVEGLLENGTLEVERDGFFETPKAVADRMLELANVQPGGFYLEPSAGCGAIVERIQRHAPAGIFMVEKNSTRAGILEDKYPGRPIVCGDFMTVGIEAGFDYVIMNPPFENMQDVDHVRRAYDLLSSGGKRVSVMAESAFFRNDRKAVEFRAWLEEVGGTSERLPDGSFKESGTGVNARLVVVEGVTMHTYEELNAEIVSILRVSDNPVSRYAAARIGYLEAE